MSTLASREDTLRVLDQLLARNIVEVPPGSNKTWIGRVYGWNGVAWCAETVSVVFALLKSLDLIGGKTASANEFAARFRKMGRWHVNGPQAGDIIVYDWNGDGWGDHVGMIRAVDSDGKAGYTVEGNCNDALIRVRRSFTTTAHGGNVLGFGRPAYGSKSHRGVKATVLGATLLLGIGSVITVPAPKPAPKPPVVAVHHPTAHQIHLNRLHRLHLAHLAHVRNKGR